MYLCAFVARKVLKTHNKIAVEVIDQHVQHVHRTRQLFKHNYTPDIVHPLKCFCALKGGHDTH